VLVLTAPLACASAPPASQRAADEAICRDRALLEAAGGSFEQAYRRCMRGRGWEAAGEDPAPAAVDTGRVRTRGTRVPDPDELE
jgi:hypothetical protein